MNEVIETEPDPQSFENPETQVLEFPIDDEPRVIDIDENGEEIIVFDKDIRL